MVFFLLVFSFLPVIVQLIAPSQSFFRQRHWFFSGEILHTATIILSLLFILLKFSLYLNTYRIFPVFMVWHLIFAEENKHVIETGCFISSVVHMTWPHQYFPILSGFSHYDLCILSIRLINNHMFICYLYSVPNLLYCPCHALLKMA